MLVSEEWFSEPWTIGVWLEGESKAQLTAPLEAKKGWQKQACAAQQDQDRRHITKNDIERWRRSGGVPLD